MTTSLYSIELAERLSQASENRRLSGRNNKPPSRWTWLYVAWVVSMLLAVAIFLTAVVGRQRQRVYIIEPVKRHAVRNWQTGDEAWFYGHAECWKHYQSIPEDERDSYELVKRP